VDDAYMFGPDLLVAPVASYGCRKRLVYLPLGSRWTSAWSGETLPGGSEADTDAPLGQIPLFLRDGATLPVRPGPEEPAGG
jgi:alpha-D-xyloside xylohydrolase